MIDLLAALFDRTPDNIIVVSGYDQSVTYANPAMVKSHDPAMHPDDVVGESFPQLMTTWGVTKEQGPLLRLLDDLEHDLFYNPRPDGQGWWVASAVPCADVADKPELLATAHRVETAALAVAEHKVLAGRVAIAMEYARCRRLQEAAIAALVDANRRLDWMGSLLIVAGSRPLNPGLADMPSLRDGVHDDQPQAYSDL